MQTNLRALALLVLLLLVSVGGYSYYGRMVTKKDAGTADRLSYLNPAYGISFTYPKTYLLEEAERGNGERRHYAITLTKVTDLPPPSNGEGPTGVSIDIYRNDIEQLTLTGWLTGTNQSNFKLSPDGTYTETRVDGAPAISYRSSGLYEADNTAFIHTGNIISIAGTYIMPEDESRRTYQDILASIDLY